MKKKMTCGSALGRELFNKNELASGSPTLAPAGRSGELAIHARRGASVDFLISRARSPCAERELFSCEAEDGANKPGFRFNFCGGTVR